MHKFFKVGFRPMDPTMSGKNKWRLEAEFRDIEYASSYVRERSERSSEHWAIVTPDGVELHYREGSIEKIVNLTKDFEVCWEENES